VYFLFIPGETLALNTQIFNPLGIDGSTRDWDLVSVFCRWKSVFPVPIVEVALFSNVYFGLLYKK
jgi:hypothetical protein